ncbi:MAG: PQQ-binding-like beta-propeller repeat protein [Planctomycetales bacterium]
MALTALVCSWGIAEDWPQWRGPRADSTWQGPELPESWPPKDLKPSWKQPIGGGYGGISVVGERLYVMDRQKEPQEVERILCFDTHAGKELWKHQYPVSYGKLDYGNGPRSTPTVRDGVVYTFGALGHACCLDAISGNLIWNKDPKADFEVVLPEWGLAASPVIFEDLVILQPGGKRGRCFVGLDKKTGAMRWRCSEDPGGYATPLLIESPSGPQLVGWTPQHVLGIDPKTGKQLWSVSYPVTYGVSISTPLYADGIVCVCGYWEGTKAIKLGDKPTDAKLVWEENKFLRGLMAPPLSKDGLVYLLDKQYGITCFELASGKKKWDDKNALTPRGRNPQVSYVGLNWEKSNRILALNSEGELVHAEFRPEGYHEFGRVKIIGPTWAAPAFAGTMMYARNDTELVAVPLNAK